jgi:predicted PurR-regulated permease PerM
MTDARTNRSRVDNMLFYVVIALLAYFVFRIFEPFLAPLGWAGVMVVVFYPITSASNVACAQTRPLSFPLSASR